MEQASRLREGGAAVTIVNNGAAMARLGAPLANGLGDLFEAMEIRDVTAPCNVGFDLRVMARRTGLPRRVDEACAGRV
ncbi:MAG TPA: hypothetical protein VGJ63_17820 [Micromonosporaceae bacterium]|nr:hypothetical protein [Actinoplanes sp.]